jgi:dephospho-CoA kinase
MSRKPVIGLLGGIGSGKTCVAAAFARQAGRVIDADRIGHDALRDPDVRRQIVERWGRGLLDDQGEIVRRRLGRIVFADDAERRALEAIVHPWIGRRIVEEITAAQAEVDSRFILLDAAIMLEAGWHAACDKLVFVDAPRPLRLERVARQRRWTATDVEARERAQLPLTEKAARADHVLDNSGTLEDLERQVDDLLRTWGMKQGSVTNDQ